MSIDVMQLRADMAKEGWDSDDRLRHSGRPDGQGYSIWFQRTDWHGKHAMALSGSLAIYQAHTQDLSKIAETAQAAAELARRALREFPDCPPRQTVEGTLKARRALGRATEY